MAETIKIGGELESMATGKIVAAASAIKDKSRNKTQEAINGDVEQAIAEQSAQFEALSEETSAAVAFSSESAREAKQYLANLQEAITELPDGQAVSAQVAINQVDIAELKTNVVVDLSTRYSTSYANLSAALTALNNDATATNIKKAGVSIKFINSSTNKYEQWNLKASSWSTDTSDWVSVTDVKAEDVSYGSSNVKEELDKTATISGNQESDLDVTDNNGYVVMRLKNGHIFTKNFDSSKSENTPVTSNSQEADLDLTDDNGYVILRLKNGHIYTKNFDSSNVAKEDYPVMYAHFSVDDVTTCISNLATNENTYTSIFDEPFFAKLKGWHDTYGMVVSLYCYNDLSSLPTKFAQDFINNKSWLKLAYHGYGTTWQSITYEAAQTIYNNFVANITSKIGDIEVLDRVPRLDYFHCTKQGCLGMRDCTNGILGFLGCDDWEYNKLVRATNYYLTDAQSTWLDKNNRLYDYGNQITFFKTDFRLEQVAQRWGTIENCLAYYEGSNQRKSFEFFTHENYLSGTSYDSMMISILNWTKLHSFTWDFPMNNLFLID